MALIKTIVQVSLVFVFFVFLFSCSDTSTPTSPAVDNIDPVVEWVHPQTGGELSGIVELRFRVFDESGVDSARVYLDGYSPDGWQISDITTELQVINWNTLDYDDGVHILEARAWDKAGNLGTSPSLRVVVSNDAPPAEDRTPPDLWWITPEAGSTLTDTVTIRIGFFDESGVDSVLLLKDGAPAISLPPAPRGGTEGGVEYLWNTRQDSDGVHLWEARAWDAAGNTGVSAGLLVRVQNHEAPPEDHTPPVITWLSPEPGDTVQGTVELHFQVMDDVGLDSAKVFVNGAVLQNLDLYSNFFDSFVTWITSDHNDGIYIVEVRAWDTSGNVGFGVGVVLMVWNNRPRVLWVPDDYRTIQAAINASRDGDTVRVRAGTYYEGLRLMNKQIWLESEEGPEATIVDASVEAFGIRVDADQDTNTVIRGLTFANANYDGISLDGNASPNIFNCIIRASLRYNLEARFSNCKMMNNVFSGSGSANVSLHVSDGVFRNNIVINSGRTAIWNESLFHNPLMPDYCLIWNYQQLTNDPPFEFGPHNIIDREPLFQEGSYKLREDSPCIDSGDPSILDIDGSRSDIGAYGGLFGYPTQ